MNQIQFMTTSQKAYILEANAISMNTVKNQQFFFKIQKKKQRGAQNIIKKITVGDKQTTGQTHILEYIKEFSEILFKKTRTKNRDRK